MLKQIYSEAFKTYNGKIRDRINLNPGLNVVLGTTDGANSIGKSSFLMVVDFIFGGDDYVDKCTDIQDNVGGHTICFAFEIDGEMKYFSRSTINRNEVSVCDSDYRELEKMSIKAYRKFLADTYGTGCEDQTFRGMVSPYLRIYQRENLNEKHPLETARKAKDQKAIDEIIKLFNRFDNLRELRKEKDEAEKVKGAISVFVKQEMIPKISPAQYKKNEIRIQELRRKLESLSKGDETERLKLVGVDKDKAEEINIVKQKVIDSRRTYSRLQSEYRAVCNNSSGQFEGFEEDIMLLKSFFPSVDARKINEIESFHKKIKGILDSEIEIEKNNLSGLLEEAKRQKKQSEEELNALMQSSGGAQKLVDEISSIRAELDNLERANSIHDTNEDAKEKIKGFKEDNANTAHRQLVEIERDLNVEMEKLNEFIYKNGRKAPIINFNDEGDGYTFMVPNDSGTGTSCRGLILFDLSILKLSPLPILVHDSVIHKQIEDYAFNKILDLYVESGKQIFIAMDKQDSFGKEVEDKLEEAAVLHLSKGGNELYGSPWYE